MEESEGSVSENMREEDKETELNLELRVDQVIEDYVGSLGFSQILHVFLVSFAWIFDAHNTLVTIFTDAKPPAWSDAGAGGQVSSVCGLSAGSWRWIGGKNSSIIAEWDLVCDRKFLAAVPASLFFIGSVFGATFYGWIGDGLLGRKKTLLLSCILTSITTFLTSISPNIWVYALLRFASGFVRCGIGISCLVLATEAVGRKWRGQVSQYGFFLFAIGFLTLPPIAYPYRTCWRKIYRVMSILPLVYSLLIIPFLSESPRWLAVKGRNKEALDVLRKYARLNGKKLPPNLILSEPSVGRTDGQAKMSLWSTKWAAARMILVMIAGFGVGCVYYGIQLNVENLDFNLYISVVLNALMEIPASAIGSVLLSYTNRRPQLSWSAFIAGGSSIICIAFSRELRKDGDKSKGSWTQLSIEVVGLMAASRAFDMLYIICLELFPTCVRNFAVSLLRQSLMLGASVGPLLVALGRVSPSLSFLSFGILSICSGILCLYLPETKNAPLYETLEQQEYEEKLNSHATDSALDLENDEESGNLLMVASNMER